MPETKGKKETPHIGKLIFLGDKFSGTFDVAFHEADVDRLLELEGQVVKVGPNGHPVETRRPYVNLEDGVEIQSSQVVKKLRYEDGTEDPYADLPKTKTFDIDEKRQISECNLRAEDPTVTYGTVIPREDVEKYAVEKVHEEWEKSPSGYRKLVDYLEQNRLALLYPYCFGRGRNLYTVIAYPVRIESKLYVLKKFCTGQILYKHPIEAPANAAQSTTKVVMPALRIRNKAK